MSDQRKAIFRAALGSGEDPLDAWDMAQQDESTFRDDTQTWQDDVRAFHEAFGLTVGTELGLRDIGLRCALLREEVEEFCDAVGDSNLTEAADAIADIIYVALGAAVTFGIDIEPIWTLVHESNMRKVGGGKDENGKVVKPEGWQPPNVKRELLRQLGVLRLEPVSA